MVPVTYTSTVILWSYTAWENTESEMTKIGFEVSAAITDGHSSNEYISYISSSS